jgi:flavin reductase (DIM6/NTAB) family NADH-FMN oxidoreductase RutF
MMVAGMAEAPYFYEPVHGHGLAHDPLNAIVAPRPIGWIASRSAAGVLNLAPYSFFNLFSYRPPLVGFASTGWKDTVRNVQETGEFVWNLATRPLADAMNATSATVPPEVSEFDVAGLTPAPCRLVSAPRVAESPVAFECRVAQVIELAGADGTPAQSWLTIGEVIGVHIAPDLIVDGRYDTTAAHPIVRGGGPADYFEITAAARFRMIRPR